MAVTLTTNAQYVQQTAGSNPTPMPSTGTLGMKLKPAGWGAGSSTTRCLVCQSSSGGQLIQITQTLGLWYCGWSNSGHITVAVANIGLVADVWNSIVLRWDNGTGIQTIYVNGVLRGTDTTGLSPTDTTGVERRWGAHTISYGTAVVEGDLADCFIANGVITTDEIAALETLPPTKALTTTSLLQYLSLNASTISGTTVVAEVGTNATLVGSPNIVSGPVYSTARARGGFRSRGWGVR